MSEQSLATITAKPAVSPASGLLQRKCACGQHTISGRDCAECKKDKEKGSLQRHSAGAASPEVEPLIVHEVLSSPGQPLDRTTREFMELRIGDSLEQMPVSIASHFPPKTQFAISRPGDANEQQAERSAEHVMKATASPGTRAYDFSRVRVHADDRAAASARAVNAHAYTVGHNIAFATGKYAPHTAEGKRLLAHELTHVVQQQKAFSQSVARQPAGTPAKRGVKTGMFKGWSYVAYLDQSLIRFARDVLNQEPGKGSRIGTVPWIANNPGNLTVSTDSKAGPAQKEPFKQGAYAKTAVDQDPKTRRYAIFSSRAEGLAAIFPVLKVLNDSNGGNLTLKAVLKIYKGVDPKEDESVKTSYVAKIKQFMVEDMQNESPSLSENQAQQEAEKILNRSFSSFSSQELNYEIARGALVREEGSAAAPGMEYSCTSKFTANNRTRYTDEQWSAMNTLKSFEADIRTLAECP